MFCIALLSVAVQGSLLPLAARKLDMVDSAESVSRTVIVLIERRAEHHKIPCLDCGISVWNHILAAPPEHHHQRVGGQLTLPDGPPHPRVARADREAGQVELPLVLVVVEGTADALSTCLLYTSRCV